MGNRRSRAARRGLNAAASWRQRLEIARQEQAARQMLAAIGGRPPSTRKLRALGALMFATCAVIGGLVALLVARLAR